MNLHRLTSVATASNCFSQCFHLLVLFFWRFSRMSHLRTKECALDGVSCASNMIKANAKIMPAGQDVPRLGQQSRLLASLHWSGAMEPAVPSEPALTRESGAGTIIKPKARAESREPRAESREPRAESREPRAESREPRAESREPRAESREPRAESREPRAESREPRAESREPRAESREPRAEDYVRRGVSCLG